MTAITGVRAYRQWQPFAAGAYGTSGGTANGFDSMVVALDTAAGVTGWGEMAPLGSFYSEAFAAGARAGVAELAPLLIGLDAAQPRLVAARLDEAMRGQPYVKSGLDMACWDAAARQQGRPLCEALGGRFGDAADLYRSVPPLPPAQAAELAAALVAAGYRRLQVKVGGDPREDADRLAAVSGAAGAGVALVADANGGWSSGAALRFVRAAGNADYELEQPCSSLEECMIVRAHCPVPMLLDESIDSMRSLLAAWRAGAVDGVTIKLSRVGGVTRAAAMRDVAVELGLGVTVEDTGGADIDTAAMVQLTLSTPAAARGATVDFNAWVTVRNGTGLPATADGRLGLPSGPGLGVDVLDDELGEPFLRVP